MPLPNRVYGHYDALMQSGRVHEQTGYTTIAQQLAQQALSIATDAAPHRPREGERRWSMARALPAARVLLGEADAGSADDLAVATEELAQTLMDATGKVTDGFGHTRPVYLWLALHLLGTAARLIDSTSTRERLSALVADCIGCERFVGGLELRLLIWRDLVAYESGMETLPVKFGEAAGAEPLFPLNHNALIDAWTYRELVGLHGLDALAGLTGDPALTARARSAALYHLGHTQPDYTTYQPWALAAFASDPETALFAEQQLHDVATHLTLEGPGGAVLPALLLADAAAAMSGRLAAAWR